MIGNPINNLFINFNIFTHTVWTQIDIVRMPKLQENELREKNRVKLRRV